MTEDLLREASARFVLKFAAYKGEINLTQLSGTKALEEAVKVQINPLDLLPSSPKSTALQLDYLTDNNDVIQSVFSGMKYSA